MFKDKKRKLDAVVELKVNDTKLVERIVGRFTCTKCEEGYHDRFRRPKVKGCVRRLRQYRVHAAPGRQRRDGEQAPDGLLPRHLALTGYYYCKGNLRTVDGMGARGGRQGLDGVLDAIK